MRKAIARFLNSCLLLASLWLPVLPAQAQDAQVRTASDWTPVSAIPHYAETALPPYMVADQNRTVHALVSMPLTDDPADSASQEVAIFYHQWTLDGGWTKPIDIMLTPVKQQARVKGVFLDDAGILHMVFFGGDEQIANIYYSSAPAAAAGSATSWSAPLAIGPNAITPDVAAIAGDGGEHLAVVYSGNLGEGNSMYTVYSDDGGVSWSEPVLVFSTYSTDKKVFDMSVSYGQSGMLHATWNVTDETGQNVAGYYTHLSRLGNASDTGLRVWSSPQVIAESEGLGVATPAVIEYQGEVLLLYNNGLEGQVAPVIWLIRSRDGGETFSTPQRAFPNHIGRNGTISLVVDGSGVLHAFFGQRIGGGFDGTTDLHGMWHSIWSNGNWGPVRPIVSGPPSPAFDPYDATAVVSQGNVILLAWRTDPGRAIRSTWYTWQVLDGVAEAPIMPLPTVSVAETSRPQVELQAEQSAALEAELEVDLEAEQAGNNPAPATPTSVPLPEFSKLPAPDSTGNPAVPLLGALAPTVLFIAAALLVGGLRRRKNPN